MIISSKINYEILLDFHWSFFFLDQIVQIIVADEIFNIDHSGMRLMYTHNHQAMIFLTNELLMLSVTQR